GNIREPVLGGQIEHVDRGRIVQVVREVAVERAGQRHDARAARLVWRELLFLVEEEERAAVAVEQALEDNRTADAAAVLIDGIPRLFEAVQTVEERVRVEHL